MAAILLSGTVLAGGILTNTNHSAMYTRMGMRVATTEIDAVYYNPAGLTKLENGIHLSINNQTLGQTRTITSDYTYLNDGEFIGEVSAPLFPNIYAAIKMGKLAISAGFMPIGGGGSAVYNSGLPSFEYGPSDLVPALVTQGQNVTGYRLDAYFDGSSVFFGYQLNVAYEINDMISVAVGGRYVTANETYMGHLKDIEINLDGTWTPASAFFSGAAAQYTAAATSLSGAATAMQPLIDGGAGGLPLTDPTLIGTLSALGLYLPGMTNAQAQATFQGAATAATVSAAESTATSTLLADQDVDAEKKASGFTPIISINIQPIDMLNIALKYEHATKLDLENTVAANKGGLLGFQTDGSPIYMFEDGAKTRLDLPAMISAGATLQPIDALLISAGMNYYLDKSADWNGREDLLDANTIDLGLGGQYAIGDRLLVSAGWSMTKVSPGANYQTDLSYTLSTHGISGGIGINIMDNVQLNVGGQYVIYNPGERTFQHDLANSGTMIIPITETLDKGVWVVGAGLNVSIAR